MTDLGSCWVYTSQGTLSHVAFHIWYLHIEIASDNLCEMSIPIFWVRQENVTTVLSTSFRKSFFLLGALNRRSKFVNFCHDLMQNHLS